MLELINVSKSYKDNQVLSDVNLKVNDGEMLVLLGPSGSGKTTILRLIAGFISDNEGQILVDNRNINTIEAHKRNIGVVFQDYALFPHMTVKQNVEFGLKMRKIPPADRDVRIREALECVGLYSLADRYPHQLSGGQQQRVAIARVVAIRAKVMLLDEPLSNLDAKLRRQVRIELKELQQQLKITTLIVTHDQEEAMTMGDRIAILHDGIIQQIGSPMELYNSPVNKFVAGFLGTPPINFFDLEIKNGRMSLLGRELPISGDNMRLLKDGLYILGVRPENILLSLNKINDNSVPVKLTLVEHLGAETLVYFNYLGNNYCCRIPFDENLINNQEAFINIDFNVSNVFDVETEECIF